MYTVRKLEQQGNRWHIFLDNNVDFLLYKGEVKKLNIQEGACMNENQYQLINEILYKRARERALYILDHSYKTEKQITDKLKSGFYPTDVIQKVIEYLSEYDLINDYRYAMLYIEYKASSKSGRQIVQDLLLKGVSKSMINKALEETGFSDETSLRKVIEKRVSKYDLSNKKDLEKLYRYLMGKGYAYDDVKRVVMDYLI